MISLRLTSTHKGLTALLQCSSQLNTMVGSDLEPSALQLFPVVEETMLRPLWESREHYEELKQLDDAMKEVKAVQRVQAGRSGTGRKAVQRPGAGAKPWAGEMAHRLRALTVLPEVLSSIPSNPMVAHTQLSVMGSDVLFWHV